VPEGPQLWANWQAYDPRTPADEAFEVVLYSDADLFGRIDDPSWPVDLMSALAPLRTGLKLTAVARIRWNTTADYDMTASDTTSYHGGGPADEVAAVVSLALGVRCRSGGITRRWLRGDPDPLGTPFELDHRKPYLPEQAGPRPLLPSISTVGQCIVTRDLEECRPLLHSFANAPGRRATALIRAARQYERALWVVEDDPNLAWLQLVSALEVAALESTADRSPAERLKTAKPELFKHLLRAGEAHAEAVAKELADQVKSTARFLDFMDLFQPDPPEHRPPPYAQVDWTKMRKHLGQVYGYRSKALHSGTPFPDPMCSAPFKDTNSCPEERPSYISAAAAGAVWQAKDLPMYLHIFAYITRGALLNWWFSPTAV
jgi:hypothetical protein